MRRYTTPTITLTLTGADLTNCRIWVTLAQMHRKAEFTRDDFDSIEQQPDDSWVITITLTQEQSASYANDLPVDVQVNILDVTGHRYASNIGQVRFGRNLKEVVVDD